MSFKNPVRALVVAVLLGLTAIGVTSSSTSAVAPSPDERAVVARFSLTVGGTEIASFSELVRIESEVDVIEFRDAADPSRTRWIPGRAKITNVTLKRGVTQSLELSSWHESIRRGDGPAVRDASLVAYDADGLRIARWNLANAWPNKLDTNGLKKGAGSVLYEALNLVAEDVQRVSP